MAEWIILEENNIHEAYGSAIDPGLAGILHTRNISPESMADFLAPRPKTTYDPFLLPDMQQAVDLILRSAEEKKQVCVYGDYDADGVTSAALLVQVMDLLFERPMYYIPSRFSDGYGLNKDAIRRLYEKGARLLITVDCGSTSFAEVDYARELGMEVIVTDHHTTDEEQVLNCIFVNPKRKDSLYPFKELSGCGVAFKLAQALQRTLAAKDRDIFPRSFLNSLLDLVAISTVADVVPLLDENRSLVKYGLDFINDRRRPGLKTLLSVLDHGDKKIDSDRIAYLLAPNINALGRMDSASLAVELFSGLKEDGSPAGDPLKLAIAMKDMNLERKAEQEKTMSICQSALEQGDCGEYCPVILAEGAHEGVAGIVAGNIKESLYRPVCILTPAKDGLLKGTGRSVPGINLYDLLNANSQLFVRYGGHAGACGLTMSPEGLETLRRNLQQQVQALAEQDPGLLTEKIIIEKELSSEEKSLSFVESLSLLEPYGEANPKPLFCLRNARVMGLRRMGSDGQHLRFAAQCSDGISVDCVLFKKADRYYDLLDDAFYVDVAGEIGINEFNGSRKLQLIVHDIKGVV